MEETCLMFKWCTTSGGFQIWYDNVPHTKLVEYKKEQNWVVKSGDYLVFPGGGTQFKEGVNHYIKFIEKVYRYLASHDLPKLWYVKCIISHPC